MDMQKCKWGDLVQNRDSLLPGMILFIILKTKTKKHHFCTKIAAIEAYFIHCRTDVENHLGHTWKQNCWWKEW